MSALAERSFAAALRDPGRPAPEALSRPGGAEPVKRFAVYRNNVMVSLIGAMETRFPAARRIVGDDCFAALARGYAAANPPRSPVMAGYGDDFAAFLDGAPGLEEVAYLADVVRLEAARTRAYHAADLAPLGPEAFAALDADRLDGLVVALHPSVEIVRSSHPVVTIWSMNAGEAALGPIADWGGEDAIVARPEMEVAVRRLPPGGAAFLAALGRGLPLGEAAEAALADAEGFDLSLNLLGLVECGLAAGLDEAMDGDPT